jgi:UDP-4-amino-4,6-dideoxy-N-acetyl-beta-L-altrosamine N-acetyltransferase
MRPLRPDDRQRVLEWRNRPEVARYMLSDHRISESEHARWFDAALTATSARHWIAELGGEPVGLFSLSEISEEHRRASWGFYVADPRLRGHGVASTAWRFLLRHAFEELGIEKLCSEVLATNDAVVRMHERFGFHVDGVLRQHVRKNDRRVDVVALSLLRDEWREREGRADD